MSLPLEDALQTALKAVCPRVYANYAPAGVAEPYVIWQIFGGESVNYVGNQVPNRRNAYVQINVWHPDLQTATLLSLQIESALIANTTLQARPLSGVRNSWLMLARKRVLEA